MKKVRIGMVGSQFAAHFHLRNFSRLESFLKEKKKYVVSGGIRNTLSVYLSNAVVNVNINPNNVLEVYAPEPHIFGEEYIAEKLETKAGWNFPCPDEDWMRGYPQELEDFVDALLSEREPISGIDLAREVVETIYAGYLSAEKGMRIELTRE